MHIFFTSLFTFILGLILVTTPARAQLINNAAMCFHISSSQVKGIHTAGILSPDVYEIFSAQGELKKDDILRDSTSFGGGIGMSFQDNTFTGLSPCERYKAKTTSTFIDINSVFSNFLKNASTPFQTSPGTCP